MSMLDGTAAYVILGETPGFEQL